MKKLTKGIKMILQFPEYYDNPKSQPDQQYHTES